MMDQFDQPRQLGPARQRVRLYVEQFLALAREGSQGEDDEQAPRIDTANHVTLDVRDLRVLAEEPDRTDHDAVVAERDELTERVAQLEAAGWRDALDAAGKCAAYNAADAPPQYALCVRERGHTGKHDDTWTLWGDRDATAEQNRTDAGDHSRWLRVRRDRPAN